MYCFSVGIGPAPRSQASVRRSSRLRCGLALRAGWNGAFEKAESLCDGRTKSDCGDSVDTKLHGAPRGATFARSQRAHSSHCIRIRAASASVASAALAGAAGIARRTCWWSTFCARATFACRSSIEARRASSVESALAPAEPRGAPRATSPGLYSSSAHARQPASTSAAKMMRPRIPIATADRTISSKNLRRRLRTMRGTTALYYAALSTCMRCWSYAPI